MQRFSTEELALVDSVNAESRIRYHAARRGFRVMQTRGREYDRRKQTAGGTYMLINETTNGVALAVATLGDIAKFLKAHDQVQRRQLH
jgi:hypothetical protein